MFAAPAFLVLALVLQLGWSPSAIAQASTVTTRQSFAGTWAPAEPERSDKLFNVGLTAIPGSGRLVIEQTATRIGVTITVPDERLHQLLANGRFYQTVIYRIYEPQGRSGGAGAGGEPTTSVTGWVGDSLVIPNPRPGTRPTTTTFSINGDRLKLETQIEITSTRVNTVTEWFTKVK